MPKKLPTPRKPSSSSDAIALLKADHKQVTTWFKQFESARSDNNRQSLAQKICSALRVHTKIEEEIFYPAIESLGSKHGEARERVLEAREEHQGIRTLLDELGELQPDNEEFDDRMKALIESVSEHADREEEEIFPFFDDLSRGERDRVSDELRNRKTELAEEYGEE